MENAAYRLGLPRGEGAAVLALTQGLSCVQLHIIPEGGAISAEMLPLLWFSLRRGPFAGFLAGAFCGLSRFRITGGDFADRRALAAFLISWAASGLACGLFRRRRPAATWGPILGFFARWLMLVLCGVYLLPETAPERFLHLRIVSPWAYFPLYHALWLGPSLVLCLAVSLIPAKLLRRFLRGEDLDRYLPLRAERRTRRKRGEEPDAADEEAGRRIAAVTGTVLEPEWDPVLEQYVYRSPAPSPSPDGNAGREGSRAIVRALRDTAPQEPEWDPVLEQYVYRGGSAARSAVRPSGLLEPEWDPELEQYVYRAAGRSQPAMPPVNAGRASGRGGVLRVRRRAR